MFSEQGPQSNLQDLMVLPMTNKEAIMQPPVCNFAEWNWLDFLTKKYDVKSVDLLSEVQLTSKKIKAMLGNGQIEEVQAVQKAYQGERTWLATTGKIAGFLLADNSIHQKKLADLGIVPCAGSEAVCLRPGRFWQDQ